MCEFEDEKLEAERLAEFRRKGQEAWAAEAAKKAAPRPKTFHLADCQRAWGNYDKRCPRCQELKGGAPARLAWGRS